jgi:hypothetical protein
MCEMELIWPAADVWGTLRRALSPVIAHAHEALPELGTIAVRSAAAGAAPLSLEDGAVVLGSDLLGPGLHAQADADWLACAGEALAPLALDRWRRAAGLLLEGLLLHRLARTLGVAAAALPLDWRTLGWAADQVDVLDPELGWLWQPAAGLMATPQRSLSDEPRRGAWLLRWRQSVGRPVAAEALLDWSIDAADWAAFGAWCRDPMHGPDASCPLWLPVAAPGPLPECAAPLSHHPVAVEAGPAGLRVRSPHLNAVVRLGAGERRVLSLGSVAGGGMALDAQPGEAAGSWVLASGELGQRVGAARGVELQLREDGVVEISLANAFVGPISGDVLSLARRFGASGFGGGRWSATELGEVGCGTLVLTDLSVDHLTIHPRKGLQFALPGQAWLERLRSALDRLSGRELRYELRGDELRLATTLRSGELLLRLERSSA